MAAKSGAVTVAGLPYYVHRVPSLDEWWIHRGDKNGPVIAKIVLGGVVVEEQHGPRVQLEVIARQVAVAAGIPLAPTRGVQ